MFKWRLNGNKRGQATLTLLKVEVSKVEVSGDNDNSLFLTTPNRAGCDNLNALAVICREYPYRYHLTPFSSDYHR